MKFVWWLGVLALAVLSAAIAKRMWRDVPTDPSTYNVVSFAAWAALSAVLFVFTVVIPLSGVRRGSR